MKAASLFLLLLIHSSRSYKTTFLGSRVTTVPVKPSAASLRMYTDDAWQALARTEKWISQMTENTKDNPYSRKEVSYSYEPLEENQVLIAANLFTKLADLRQVGEQHALREEERRQTTPDSSYEPSTLRQTNVVVLPSSSAFHDFSQFDAMIELVNEARRQARDYMTLSPTTTTGSSSTDWNVAVNCAHLHPSFGMSNSESSGQDAWEQDPRYVAYKEQKLKARRSPYPTIVLEVRAMPPPSNMEDYEASQFVDHSEIAKLESLFGQSSLGDPLHNALEQHLESLSPKSPMEQAEEWIMANKQHSPSTSLSLTQSDCTQVDEAYAFLLTNASMLLESSSSSSSSDSQYYTVPGVGASSRYYCILPQFLPHAATSLEKFSTHLQGLLDLLSPGIQVSVYHPEHVESSRRSPMPIVSLSSKSS